MTCDNPPHWIDIVSDLLTHIELLQRTSPTDGDILTQILVRTIADVLALQSDVELVRAHTIAVSVAESELSGALLIEVQRREQARTATASMTSANSEPTLG